ncbi:unnamed protein product [Mesocestoides corti]|uniref:Condensin complex subunit 2 n=2 Tax=Mesocestoides corti TaxID=53468 RepID=A0A0R3UFN1_MESCO|nr:unnamed protein product [Mesocestoides corti]
MKTPNLGIPRPPWLDSQAADAAEGVPQDGEADDVGHLQNVDDDYDDDDDDIAPYDGIFTQGNENAPAATVVEGDGSVELVAPPRQIARLEIGYARSAKLINVRHLKGVLWAMLEDRLLSVASALDQVSPAKKTRTSEAVSSGQGDEESGDPAKSSLTASSFNDLLTSLPAKVSKQTAGELSVAIGLNCLLHLANEKDLFLETNDDFTDIRISQGLSASELELLSSYQQRSAQAGLRPKKQLSLDPWLDRSDEEDV